jgi:hypothetical protein
MHTFQEVLKGYKFTRHGKPVDDIDLDQVRTMKVQRKRVKGGERLVTTIHANGLTYEALGDVQDAPLKRARVQRVVELPATQPVQAPAPAPAPVPVPSQPQPQPAPPKPAPASAPQAAAPPPAPAAPKPAAAPSPAPQAPKS